MARGLSGLINEEHWFAAFLVGIPVFVFLFRMLYNLITELKERKLNDFKKALEIDGLSDETKFIVQEGLNQAYFFRATGITASPYMREKICSFLRFTDKNVSLFSLWRSSDYITLRDGKVIVDFDRMDRADYVWQIGSMIVTGLFSLLALAFLLANIESEFEGKWILVLEVVVLLVMTAYAFWKILSYRFARDKLAVEFELFEASSEGEGGHKKQEEREL